MTIERVAGSNPYYRIRDQSGKVVDTAMTREVARRRNQAYLPAYKRPARTGIMRLLQTKRRALKLKAEAMAHQLCVSPRMISKYETDVHMPRVPMLLKMFKILGFKLALIDTSDGTVWDVSGDQPLRVPTQSSPRQTVLLGPRNGTSSERPSSPTDTTLPNQDRP